jgi:hypothetical protein
VGYLLHILGQWVSSAQVNSFFCNLLRSHVSRLHASGKKHQEFHFGFVNTKQSTEIWGQTEACQKDWAPALGLGKDYKRLSAFPLPFGLNFFSCIITVKHARTHSEQIKHPCVHIMHFYDILEKNSTLIMKNPNGQVQLKDNTIADNIYIKQTDDHLPH